VILLTAHLDSGAVYEALGAGAAGYLSKDSGPDEICDAIAAVHAGGTVLGREVQANVAGAIRERASRDRPALTPREAEILSMIAAGRSAPDIGKGLNLSTATVKTHLQHLYEKLGVSDRAAAVAEAMRRGLID
jgi:two-component system nitrate/nitrite response regulator NarL